MQREEQGQKKEKRDSWKPDFKLGTQISLLFFRQVILISLFIHIYISA